MESEWGDTGNELASMDDRQSYSKWVEGEEDLHVGSLSVIPFVFCRHREQSTKTLVYALHVHLRGIGRLKQDQFPVRCPDCSGTLLCESIVSVDSSMSGRAMGAEQTAGLKRLWLVD